MSKIEYRKKAFPKEFLIDNPILDIILNGYYKFMGGIDYGTKWSIHSTILESFDILSEDEKKRFGDILGICIKFKGTMFIHILILEYVLGEKVDSIIMNKEFIYDGAVVLPQPNLTFSSNNTVFVLHKSETVNESMRKLGDLGFKKDIDYIIGGL